MRPVNLIPADQRRDGVSVRTGPVAYLIVGALALGLAALTMVVLTNNKISDRKATIADLNQQKALVDVRAAQLKPFIDFKQAEETRVKAIRQLANTRFDWNRVMHELSLILPSDVSLTKLDASTGADASATGGAATGPTLQFSGCARTHEAVASFLASLQDIDGVTDSTLQNSKRPDNTADSASASGESCGKTIEFTVSAVFGDAPGAQASATDPAAAASTATAPTTDTTDTSASTSTAGS
jgi:Tfp pilus assembly protein PilN